MKRNFTLIELLVVIAIIAVLAAMLLPALNKARERAKKSDCLSRKKQMMLGMQFYSNDFRGYMPVYISNLPWSVLISGGWHGTGTTYIPWKILGCPSTQFPGGQKYSDVNDWRHYVSGAIWSNAVNSASGDAKYDERAATLGIYQNMVGSPGTTGKVYITARMKAPSRTPLLVDSFCSNLGNAHYGKQHYYVTPAGGSEPESAYWAAYHNGTATAGFVDGHAEALPPQKWAAKYLMPRLMFDVSRRRLVNCY